MADKNNIPQLTGAAYQGWAFKVRFGLIEKELHRYVVDFKGRTIIPRPAVIEPLTQATVNSLPNDAAARRALAEAHQQSVNARNLLVDEWDAHDLLGSQVRQSKSMLGIVITHFRCGTTLHLFTKSKALLK